MTEQDSCLETPFHDLPIYVLEKSFDIVSSLQPVVSYISVFKNVHHRLQVIPAPFNHFKVTTVGSPEFIGLFRLAPILFARLETDCFRRPDLAT